MKRFNSSHELREMIRRYLAGTASDAEIEFLNTWEERIDRQEDLFAKEPEISRLHQKVLIEKEINKRLNRNKIRKIYPLWARIAVAAAVFIILSVAVYLAVPSLNQENQSSSVRFRNDIDPGSDKAVLTLADGRKIILDTAENGQLATQSDITITKTANGQVVYQAEQYSSRSEPTAYNTIATPPGGQFQVILPDGTKVWLNAASSIKFPASFNKDKRVVEMSGEVYFEVTKLYPLPAVAGHGKKNRRNLTAGVPFLVQTVFPDGKGKQQQVEVLGTHFNINAYSNEEAIKTTLFEGSVKVSGEGSQLSHSEMLRPGQQSLLYYRKTTKPVLAANADLEEALAWKNGYFKFDGNIENIMRQVARWYNIEVRYDFKPEDDLIFGGKISRSKKLSSILHIMELTGRVHFKIEGRRVTVTE